MNLDAFMAKYNGKRVGDGQCGTLVRQYWIEVDKTSPPSYPNSKDYWFNPVPGYTKSQTPQGGSIAIYNGHGAFPEGHSAIYIGNGQVFEQNADPDGSPAHVFARANTYLLGYLTKEGSMQDIFNEGDRQNKNFVEFGEDLGYWKDKIGKTYKEADDEIQKSPEFVEHHYFNSGDVVNVKNKFGLDLAPFIGSTWKGPSYFIIENAPNGDVIPYNGPQLFTKKGS